MFIFILIILIFAILIILILAILLILILILILIIIIINDNSNAPRSKPLTEMQNTCVCEPVSRERHCGESMADSAIGSQTQGSLLRQTVMVTMKW